MTLRRARVAACAETWGKSAAECAAGGEKAAPNLTEGRRNRVTATAVWPTLLLLSLPADKPQKIAHGLPMTAASASALDPRAADAMMSNQSIVELMQHPKLMAAIAALKEDPKSYAKLVADDPELAGLFQQLQGQMETTESSVSSERRGLKKPPPPSADDAPPPLLEADAAEAEAAKAEGGAAFAAGDFGAASPTTSARRRSSRARTSTGATWRRRGCASASPRTRSRRPRSASRSSRAGRRATCGSARRTPRSARTTRPTPRTRPGCCGPRAPSAFSSRRRCSDRATPPSARRSRRRRRRRRRRWRRSRRRARRR